MLTERPICRLCGIKPAAPYGPYRGGWQTMCWTCKQTKHRLRPRNRKNLRARAALMSEDPTCRRCGFLPEHPSQMDIDHIDANKHNNDPSNLRLLCSNCHRLKTWEEREPVRLARKPHRIPMHNGWATRTHCAAGHLLEGENIRLYKGWRICKPCHRLRNRGWRAKAEARRAA